MCEGLETIRLKKKRFVAFAAKQLNVVVRIATWFDIIWISEIF